MKKIKLSMILATSLFFLGQANAQCSADFTWTSTGVPGEFIINDLSVVGNGNSSVNPDLSNANISYPLQPFSTSYVHQYATNGFYLVQVTVDDTINNCVSTHLDTIVVTNIGATNNCNASFTLVQDSTNQGLYYGWNTSTPSSSSNTLLYAWDFGDGNTSTSAYPTHTYSGVGTFVICLTITESGPAVTCTSTFCDTIVVTVRASGTTLQILPADASLSTEELDAFATLTAYPNPTSGNLRVALDAKSDGIAQIKLFNLTGQVLSAQERKVQVGNNLLEMDYSDLPTGIYLLQIKDKQSETSKMVRILKK